MFSIGQLSVQSQRRSATGQLTLSTILMPAEWTGPASPPAASPARIAAISRSPIWPSAAWNPSTMACGTPSLSRRLPPEATFWAMACVQMPSEFGPEWIAVPPALSTARTCRYSMNFPALRTSSTACAALSPCSMKSSAIGPSVGSVTFWEATAPTPARAKEQRAATAGEEEEMARPNMPVCAQRATSEKVIGSLRYDGSAVDLDKPLGPRQRLYDQPGRDGMHALDILAHGPVDGLAVAHVGDIDDDLDEVLHRPAGLLDQLLDVLHDLVGLLGRIMTVQVERIVEVLRALPPQVDRLAALRDNRLAEVVVEVLLGIGVAGVELADAGMGHDQAPSCCLSS